MRGVPSCDVLPRSLQGACMLAYTAPYYMYILQALSVGGKSMAQLFNNGQKAVCTHIQILNSLGDCFSRCNLLCPPEQHLQVLQHRTILKPCDHSAITELVSQSAAQPNRRPNLDSKCTESVYHNWACWTSSGLHITCFSQLCLKEAMQSAPLGLNYTHD